MKLAKFNNVVKFSEGIMRSFPSSRSILSLVLILCVTRSQSIIYNEITGRCVNMKSLSGAGSMDKNKSVLALPCSWDASSKRVDNSTMLDEWLELFLVLSSHSSANSTEELEEKFYSIRSAIASNDVCISSTANTATASTLCNSRNALFKFEAEKGSNKDKVFRIVDSNGLCLTTQLGREKLLFKSCTQRQKLFQRWSICRHNKNCDVDITWTPRRIQFPDKETSKVEESQGKLQTTEKLANSNSNSLLTKCNVQDYYQNEVLYSIQNGIDIYGSGENFLVLSVANFFPPEIINEAQNMATKICQDEKLQCIPCSSSARRPLVDKISTTEWLFAWIAECNRLPEKERRFLSRNVLHVPQHFFPKQESSEYKSSQKELYEAMILSLKRYLASLEAKVKDHHDHVHSTLNTGSKEGNLAVAVVGGNVEISDKTDKIESSPTMVSSSSSPNESTIGYYPDIDIRIIHSVSNISRVVDVKIKSND